jgi:TorA maturation chaperone TorD
MEDAAVAFGAQVLAAFLAQAPTQQTWNVLKAEGLLEEWFIHSSNQESTKLWQEAQDHETLEEIGADFTRLFLCDEEFLKAPPYGGYYLDQSGETYTQESDAVLAFYRQHGFDFPLLRTEPADHLAIELAFLGTLLHNMSVHPAFRQSAETFVAYHLAPWVKGWAGHVKMHARSAFYKGLGFRVEEYVEGVCKRYNIHGQERKLYRLVS